MSSRHHALVRRLEDLGLSVTEGERGGLTAMTCEGFDTLSDEQLDAVSEIGHDRPVTWWLVDAPSGRYTACGARYSTSVTRGFLREVTGR